MVQELYEARRLLGQTLAIDPRYARAYALLSNTFVIAYQQPVDGDYINPVALDRAYELASKSVQLDPTLPLAHAKLGNVLTWKRELELGIAAFERAFELNPNFADWRFAAPLVLAGQCKRAILFLDAHKRIDPFYPPLVQNWAGFAHYMLQQYSDAIPLLRDGVSRAPKSRMGHAVLAAAYAQLGDNEEARREAAEVLRIDPAYTIEETQSRLSPFKTARDEEHFFDGLRKAGLPE